MIDPANITNYNLNKYELEEHILFWLLVAGKTARVVAKSLDRILQNIDAKPYKPFKAISSYKGDLAQLLKKNGVGCFNGKAKGILKLINSNLDLKTCTLEELLTIPWIGPKTARCFIVHSRANARHACLDTHVLKYLKEQGYEVPPSTPTGRKYLELEKVFLKLADKKGLTPAVFDLQIWNHYAKKASGTT